VGKGGNIVGPRFFETMSIELLQGREFSTGDTAGSPKVAIVSESVARKSYPNESPIGRRLIREIERPLSGDIQIVGVVRDTKHSLWQQKGDEAVYLPYTQAPPQELGQIKFFVRAAGNPAAVAPVVRQQVQSVESDLPLIGLRTQTEEMEESAAGGERSLAALLSFFGVLALSMASIGLYGTMSYAVGARTKEIGIRIALGARGRDILSMVLREALSQVAIGVIIGIPLAIAATRLLSSMLFGVTNTDPVTISIAIFMMSAVALVAGYVPARRAAKVDPMVALRYE
jgi:predicted permease